MQPWCTPRSRDWCTRLAGWAEHHRRPRHAAGHATRHATKEQAKSANPTQQPEGDPIEGPCLGLLEVVREEEVGAQRDGKPDQVRRVEEVPKKEVGQMKREWEKEI